MAWVLRRFVREYAILKQEVIKCKLNNMCTKNVGGCDRAARLVAAIIVAFLGYYKLDGTWQVVAYAFSSVAFITAVVRFCPMYVVWGIDSTKCSCKMCGSCNSENAKKQ